MVLLESYERRLSALNRDSSMNPQVMKLLELILETNKVVPLINVPAYHRSPVKTAVCLCCGRQAGGFWKIF